MDQRMALPALNDFVHAPPEYLSVTPDASAEEKWTLNYK
jgi:hypothetical protein